MGSSDQAETLLSTSDVRGTMENLLVSSSVFIMSENEIISKELEDYLSKLSIFSEETKNEVRAEQPERCLSCYCCQEEFLEIEIENKEDTSQKGYIVQKALISSLISFYVRHCSYVPFFYLAILIFTSSIFGEAFSFIFSLVMSLCSVLIHYHYHSYYR